MFNYDPYDMRRLWHERGALQKRALVSRMKKTLAPVGMIAGEQVDAIVEAGKVCN